MNIHWRTKITVNSKTQVRDEAGLRHTAEKSTEKKRIRCFDQEQPPSLIELYRNPHRMEEINSLERLFPERIYPKL